MSEALGTWERRKKTRKEREEGNSVGREIKGL
jgi:hypothetical protein